MSLTGGRSRALLSTGLLHLVLILLPTLTQAQEDVQKAHQDMRPALVRIEGVGETPAGESISVFGTGVLLNAKGTILTALHVLAPLEASDPSKVDIRVRIRAAAEIAHPAASIDDIEPRDLAFLRISDPPEDLSYACRTTSGDGPDNLPMVLTSGFEGDGSYVVDQGTIASAGGPDGTIRVRMPAFPAQSGSPVYTTSGEVVGILKGSFDGRESESVFIPLSDVLGRLPPPPADCLRGRLPTPSLPELATAKWGEWQSLGGQILDAPNCVSRAPDRIDCFARGIDNTMYHHWWDGIAWQKSQSPDQILDAPDCVSQAPDRIDCFARRIDNAMYHQWWKDGSTWSGWQSLGGQFLDAPDCVSGGENRIDCFAPGTDHAMYHSVVGRL